MAFVKCDKVPYRDKERAVKALHKINNQDDGREKPTRVYQCDECLKWHLTKQPIDQDRHTKYTPLLDWSRILKNE